MSDADYLRLGDWNIKCDRCGFKMKGSEAVQTWQGYWVHPRCFEPRHPQDFVRAVAEHPSPPFVRNPADILLGSPVGIVSETDVWPNLGDTDPNYIFTEGGALYFLTES